MRPLRSTWLSLACLSLLGWAPLLLGPLGCSSEGDADGGHDGLGGASGLEDAGLGGPGDDGSGLGRAGFRFGINLGHPNPDFDDASMSDLAAESGARSIRLKYPETHFAEWGADIEVGDAEHYASLGMKEHAAFVIGMTAEHSTAPAGTERWELDYYIPENLYEPIFLESGEINPDNYFAAYLETTMSTYAEWVRYWEIWNEPDWVDDWQVTESWYEEPPTREQLPRFNGSIFDYVRMLRIAYEVKEKVAPDSYVMTGGIGYPSFLSAILRYTDNPDGGAVSEAYPYTGAAYFDVVSFHHYPHLVEDGSSDAGLDSFTAHRDELMDELVQAGVPHKGWMVTETGASRRALPSVASGPAYARNYLLKAMLWAKAEGFLGVDWFILSDGTDEADPFDHMGLYADISGLTSPELAARSETGVAYATLSALLDGARLDLAASEALELPKGARGYVFRQGEQSITALWAETRDDEAPSLELALPTEQPVELLTWDSLGESDAAPLVPSDGAVSVSLGGSPVFLVAD
jgi:hypothetical protein